MHIYLSSLPYQRIDTVVEDLSSVRIENRDHMGIQADRLVHARIPTLLQVPQYSSSIVIGDSAHPEGLPAIGHMGSQNRRYEKIHVVSSRQLALLKTKDTGVKGWYNSKRQNRRRRRRTLHM